MSLRDLLRGSVIWPITAGHVRPLSGRLLRSAVRYERELWFTAISLMLIDITLTVHGLQHGLVELNPLANTTLDTVGVPGLYGLKLCALAIAFTGQQLIPSKYAPLVPLALVFPTAIAVVNNTVLLLLLGL